MMTLRRWLVIMVKQPVAGRVKARLARDIGVAGALRFYRAQTAAVIRRLSADPRWQLVLAVAPDIAVNAPVWPPGIARIAQGPGNLGARMQRIFDRLPPGPVAIIGSDIPGITPDHVARAFHALGDADAVLGPAGDGGYWLVGAKRRPSVLPMFANVRWSTCHTLADTRANLVGHKVTLVDTLDDVDDAAGLRAMRANGF